MMHFGNGDKPNWHELMIPQHIGGRT